MVLHVFNNTCIVASRHYQNHVIIQFRVTLNQHTKGSQSKINVFLTFIPVKRCKNPRLNLRLEVLFADQIFKAEFVKVRRFNKVFLIYGWV